MKSICTITGLLLFVSSVLAQNLYNQPESVVFDAHRNRYLVSNKGDGKIIEVNESGTQSVFSDDQSSIRGLCVSTTRLFAASDAGVAVYDLENAQQLMTITIAGQGFLNDITADHTGMLYVTDTQQGKVYRVDPRTQASSDYVTGLDAPNGILYDQVNKRLLVCHWKSNSPVTAIDMRDRSVTTVRSTELDQLDGLTEDNESRIYVSSAGSNAIYRFDRDFTRTPELVSEGHSAPADIFYNKQDNVLAIPNFNANTVDFITFTPPVSESHQVSNTLDDGPGTLRAAILEANSTPGPDTIRFNIPVTDPHYNANKGTWTITPASPLPALQADGTFIDGHSQGENQGDSNPDGLEIVIDGSRLPDDGLVIASGHNHIAGLVINTCPRNGIVIQGGTSVGNLIESCYIGTDADGQNAMPNRIGIRIRDIAPQNHIGGFKRGNVISGNHDTGIIIEGESTWGNVIQGNFIGLDRTGRVTLPNGKRGIMIADKANDTTIGGAGEGEGNVIGAAPYSGDRLTGNGILILNGRTNSIRGNFIGVDRTLSSRLGNGYSGICIIGGAWNWIGGLEPGEGNVIAYNKGAGIRIIDSENNQALGNFVGTGPQGNLQAGNTRQGILLCEGATKNLIGPENVIAFNEYGVMVEDDSSLCNKILKNSIYDNINKGIMIRNGGNSELSAPVITSVTAQGVNGQAPAGMTIEIFSDDSNQGRIFEGSVKAKNPGRFIFSKVVSGPVVTATATDTCGNTSGFSIPLATGIQSHEHAGPLQFELIQNHPNPFNASTRIDYSIPESGHVSLKIYNTRGKEVTTLVDGHQSKGTYSIVWQTGNDSRLHLATGLYFYQLKQGNRQQIRKLLLVK